LTLLLGTLFPGAAAEAQTRLEKSLAGLPGHTYWEYLDPFLGSMGNTMDRRIWSGVHLRTGSGVGHFRVNVSRSRFGGGERYFEVRSPEGSAGGPAATYRVPTVVGSTEAVLVPGDQDRVQAYPGGFDLGDYLMVWPEVTVDGGDGVEFMFRWLANFSSDRELGYFWVYGLGARHDFTGELGEDSPLHVLVGLTYHRMTVGKSAIAMNVYSLGGQVGREWGSLSAYANLSAYLRHTTLSFVSEQFPEPTAIKESRRKLGQDVGLAVHYEAGHGEATLEGSLSRPGEISASLGTIWP
jgi:Family of unknown function (DUF6588)